MSSQRPRHRGAPSLIMIDQSHDMRPRAPAGGEEDALGEARLRQQAIGVKLRQMFDQVVAEPVPDEFLAILRKADEKGSAR